MKNYRFTMLFVFICSIVFNTIAFAETAQEEFLRQYDDYWNSVYKKEGYSDYEEYAEAYYKSQNNSDVSYGDDDYDDDYDETISDKKTNYNMNLFSEQNNIKQNNSIQTNNLEFGGKTIEQCPKEAYLYINNYNMKKYNLDICTPSPYHYDSSKTLYFYPVYDNGKDYISFIVLNQDNLNNCDNALIIYNYCQFMIKEDGSWSKDVTLNNNGKEITTTCNEELENYNKAINQVANDLVLLYHTNNENNQENVVNQEWYIHTTDDKITQNYKERYCILSKNKDKFYVLNSEKQNDVTKQQELGKLGFQYVNQMTELANEFDKAMKEYLNIAASMDVQAVKAYQPRLKSYYDTLSSVVDAFSYDSSFMHDINIVKGMLRDARNMFTFLR